jgi:acyl-CoA thioester hydrolase
LNKVILSERVVVPVRFSEVDSLRIVWHGHYIKYFEEGREAFGRKYGLGYLQVFENGLLTPIVHTSCDYKKPLQYGDCAVVETKFVDCDAAKLIFEFIVYNQKNMEIVAEGKSIQVFLDKNFELILNIPPFFAEWKKKVGLN